MLLKTQRITGYLQNPDASVRGALVFGPNTGLVRERAQTICTAVVEDPNDPFTVTKLGSEQRRQDRALLGDEVSALSLTGGKRVVWLLQAGNQDTDTIETVLTPEFPSAAFLLVEAGDLGRRDRLRVLFEKAENAAALACYDDDSRTIENFVLSTCRSAHLRIDGDTAALLAGRLSPDRRLAAMELEKLIVYKLGGSDIVTGDDVDAVIGDNALMKVDSLALSALSGETSLVDRELDRLFAEAVAPIQIIRAVSRHLTRCHMVLSAVGQGTSMENAVKQLRPPIFWRDQPVMKRILHIWTLPQLEHALSQLIKTEIDLKTTGYPDHAICRRTLLSLSAGSRRRA